MRERFIAYVVCPKCGQKGAAVWEENEDPVYQRGDWARTLTRVSEGFRTGPAEKIFCAVCEVEAVVGPNRMR
jgi:uncharacterized Zn finger protein (UPF0148 family)